MTGVHDWACLDEEGVLDECVCGLADRQFEISQRGPVEYGDPSFDRDRPYDWKDPHDEQPTHGP